MACSVNIWVHLERMCLLCSLGVVFDMSGIKVVDDVVQMVFILTLYVVAVLIAKRGC